MFIISAYCGTKILSAMLTTIRKEENRTMACREILVDYKCLLQGLIWLMSG
jgi:hypothetical protein